MRRGLASSLAGVLVISLLQATPATPTAPSPAMAEEATPGAALTEVQAAARARKSGRPVEVLALRGERRDVRALPGGGFELVQHVRPVRTRKNGAWVKIDKTLRRAGNTVVPAATAVDLRLSAGGSGPLVTMARAGRTMSLSWPAPLPEPELDGDTAVYRGVLGQDVDLQVRVDVTGFAHTLVVKSAAAAKDPRLADIAFKLSTPGMKVTQEASGRLVAREHGSGSEVFDAPTPVMWDSTQPTPSPKTPRGAVAAPSAEAPGEGAKVAPLQVKAAPGQVMLRTDQQLLTSPSTRFPVYIDPVWDTKIADRWGMVTSGSPNSSSGYKYPGTEGVGRCEVAKDARCQINQTKRVYFQMPLSSLSGRYVESAEFVAYETHAYNCNNPTVVELWRLRWQPEAPTWNSMSDDWLEKLAGRDVAYCSRTPVEFGGAGSVLRSHVQAALDARYTTFTVGLRARDESSMTWWKRFADDAYLKIQYNNPPLQAKQSTMFSEYGGACVDKPAPWVNTKPKLNADLKLPLDAGHLETGT